MLPDQPDPDTPDPSPWSQSTVEYALGGTPFAGRVAHIPVVTSTSTLAMQAAQAGAPEPAVWVADEQTAGRGRGGHQWHSAPRAGLYCSILLRPRLDPAQALWLSLATALAVQYAVQTLTGIRPDIRWPNDLLFSDKKFGGILVETAISPTTRSLRYAIIGIGINVAHTRFPPGLESTATSIRLATTQVLGRELLLAAILKALDREIVLLHAEQAAPPLPSQTLLARFTAASSWVTGKAVQVGDPPTHTGITSGLDCQGFLQIVTSGGTLHTVLSGGVRSLEAAATRP